MRCFARLRLSILRCPVVVLIAISLYHEESIFPLKVYEAISTNGLNGMVPWRALEWFSSF